MENSPTIATFWPNNFDNMLIYADAVPLKYLHVKNIERHRVSVCLMLVIAICHQWHNVAKFVANQLIFSVCLSFFRGANAHPHARTHARWKSIWAVFSDLQRRIAKASLIIYCANICQTDDYKSHMYLCIHWWYGMVENRITHAQSHTQCKYRSYMLVMMFFRYI